MLPAAASIAAAVLLVLGGVLLVARPRQDGNAAVAVLPAPAGTSETVSDATATQPVQPLIAGATPPLPVLSTSPPPAPPAATESPRPPTATPPAAPSAPPTPSAPVPTPRPATYVVQPGDSISAIAVRFGLDAVSLSQINGIPWNATIFPGEVIRLQ